MTADDPEALWAWVNAPSGARRPRRLEAPARAARVPRSAPQPVRRARRRAAPRAGLTLTARRAMQRRCNAAVVVGPSIDRRETRQCDEAQHRGLSTARAALQVAWLLAARARGRPRRRGRRDARQERLDRLQPARQPVRRGRRRRTSPAASTASRRRSATRSRPAPSRRRRAARPRRRRRRPARAHAQALLPRRRARRRAATSCSSAALQGMPKLPGLKPRDRATTPTRSRSARSCSRWPAPEVVERYLAARPAALHAAHDHRPATRCATSCASVRRTRLAVEREEFDDDFCCIAAPVLDARGRFLARDRDLDVAPRLRRRARDARGDRRRRRRWRPARRPATARRIVPAPATSPVSSHLPKRRRFLIRAVARA